MPFGPGEEDPPKFCQLGAGLGKHFGKGEEGLRLRSLVPLMGRKGIPPVDEMQQRRLAGGVQLPGIPLVVERERRSWRGEHRFGGHFVHEGLPTQLPKALREPVPERGKVVDVARRVIQLFLG